MCTTTTADFSNHKKGKTNSTLRPTIDKSFLFAFCALFIVQTAETKMYRKQKRTKRNEQEEMKIGRGGGGRQKESEWRPKPIL